VVLIFSNSPVTLEMASRSRSSSESASSCKPDEHRALNVQDFFVQLIRVRFRKSFLAVFFPRIGQIVHVLLQSEIISYHRSTEGTAVARGVARDVTTLQ
jgi:hypothetical protein